MGVRFPATSDELKVAGYEYVNDGRCSGTDCGASIEWWLTPAGKRQPMSVKLATDLLHSNAEVREPHHATCPNVGEFRRKP